MTSALRKAALLGDVLSEGDDLRVVVQPHVFLLEKHELRVAAGSTVAEAVSAAALHLNDGELPKRLVCLLDGHSVPRDRWDRVRPKPGTTIVLRAAPEGPIALAIGGIIGAIQSATVALSGFLGSLGILGNVIGVGLSIAANYILNALFGARPAQLSNEPDAEKRPSYSIGASRNESNLWGAVPAVLGEHRVTPPYGARPYTEIVGDDQYLRLLFVWGYAPLDVSDIKVGETPIASFQDVEIETRVLQPGTDAPSLYPSQVLEEPLSVELKNADGWLTRTTAPDVTYISYDVVLPQGLYTLTDTGKKIDHTINVEANYRPVGSAGDTGWMFFPGIPLVTKSVDALRFTRGMAVAKGQYEVRIRRASPDYESTKEENFIDSASWTALRGFRPGRPITFPHPLVITALRIRATSQLNGTLDTLNGMVRSATVMAPGSVTRNPADLFWHVLKGNANARPLTDETIDVPTLGAWSAYCQANSFFFDKPLLSSASVLDVLSDIAAAGRAVPIFRDGKWSVVWDRPQDAIAQLFTPSNSWGFEAERVYPDSVHGFRIRFVNREKGYVEDERIVYDDGYDATNATLFEGLEFPGVTDPAAIWRHGRFHIAQLRLRPFAYTFYADWEHVAVERGDRVRVAHDVLMTCPASGRVKSVNAATQQVVLSETIALSATSYKLRFRLANGEELVRIVSSVVSGESQTAQLLGTGQLPAPGDLFILEEYGIDSAIYRIKAIESGDDMSAKITVVDDAPQIAFADQGVIPPFSSPVTAPIDLFHLPPRNIGWQEFVDYFEERPLARLRVTWQPPSRGDIASYQGELIDLSRQGSTWRPVFGVLAPALSADLTGLDPAYYRARVRAVFKDGQISRWLESDVIDATRMLQPPPDITGFAIETLGPISTLTWDAPRPEAGVSFAEIRFISGLGPATWNTATPLRAQAQSGVQVPTMVGTYLIKAGRANGSRSANASLVRSAVATLDSVNIVETLDEAGFAGMKDRVELLDGNLRLARRTVMSTWERLSDVTNLRDGDGGADTIGVEVDGIYTFLNAIDLGEVATSRVSIDLAAYGESVIATISNWLRLTDIATIGLADPEEWSVGIDISTSDFSANTGPWSEFRPLTIGDITARAMRFRAHLHGVASNNGSGSYSVVTPVITGLSVTVDMPDRVLGIEDIAIPEAGRRVTFDPPFRAVPAIVTNDQGMETGDVKAITGKSKDGFTIRFFDMYGVPVARTVDVVAKGYGSIRA